MKKAITDKWGPQAKAIWLCDSRTDAREHYGRDLETGKRTGAKEIFQSIRDDLI